MEAFADNSHSFATDVAEPTSKRRRSSNEFRANSRPDKDILKTGEQVAAKVLSSNENGSWILGNIIDYDPHRDVYEVQDEDETSRIMHLSSREVRKLDDSTSQHRKGDSVLCVFPETTSFYRAIVAKNPKPPLHGNSGWELIVRFEDDEDDSGHAPPRRVPGRFALRRSDVEDDEDD